MKKKRIFILGTIGSGKSTFAEKLSDKLKIKHYDLDNIYWTKKFSKKRSEKQRDIKLNQLVDKKSWIIEGVYVDWIEPAIMKSDRVILLKIPLRTLFYRITKRTIKREKSKAKGKERYKKTFKGYLGLLKAVKNYYKKSHRRGYFKHKELIEKHKVEFIELRNQTQIDNFLKNM